MTQRDRLAALLVELGIVSDVCADIDADALLGRGVCVVDQGEHVISAATYEALCDVVRVYLANDEKGLLGACADLSAGMEAC